MKILPLKGEVEAVVAVLRDDTYEDEPAMAKAIIRALWPEIAKRDSFVVLHKMEQDDEGLCYGSFLYKDEAVRFRERVGPDIRKGWKVYSAASLLESMDRYDAEAKAAAKR